MGLQGNLEDLPLLDIIQIVSFSKKTGYLSIEMDTGEGAIVFDEGLVVSAFTADSPPADPRMDGLAPELRERAVRTRIGYALEQLVRLRQGAFAFELCDRVPATIGRRDIGRETLRRGVNPQELLFDLAEGIEEDVAQSAAAVEASFAAPAEEETVVEVEELAPVAPERPVEPLPGPSPTVAAVAGDPELQAQPVAQAAAAPAPALPAVPEFEPIPAAAPAPAEEERARTLLVVDDEEDVREILCRHFRSAGYEIEEAGDADEAAKTAARLRDAGVRFVLVTDLGMPASGGASFHGGFEVVKRLWKMNVRPPVLMMTESFNQSLKLRARQMGVQDFVFKPTLSKLNPRQFEADLEAFSAKLTADVLPRLAEAAVLRPPAPTRKQKPKSEEDPDTAPIVSDQQLVTLRRRLVELRQGGDANEIASLVMKVARESFERALLFVVKNDEARGLGGFGLAPRGDTLNLVARQVAIPLDEPSLFRDVAHGRRTFRGRLPSDRWVGHLMGRIGRFQSRGALLLPLVAHRETVALLFGDNPETGREPVDTAGVELFVEQAGVALENVFLQRKLRSVGDKTNPGA